jgi:pilus assembly protein CpaD
MLLVNSLLPQGVSRSVGFRTSVAGFGLVLLIVLSLSLSGCRDTDGISNVRAIEMNDPEKRHPIQFASRPEVLFVELQSHKSDLSPSQRRDVVRFVRRFRSESTDRLEISMPASINQHLLARGPLRDIETILQGNSVDSSAVRIVRDERIGNGRPALRLSYSRPVAVPPRCGDWPKDLGVDRERVHFENFGCATQRNFALTAGNARDIMGPQPSSPRSSERRDTIWNEYISEKGMAPEPASSSAATTN